MLSLPVAEQLADDLAEAAPQRPRDLDDAVPTRLDAGCLVGRDRARGNAAARSELLTREAAHLSCFADRLADGWRRHVLCMMLLDVD
jgi:hypothetical protein